MTLTAHTEDDSETLDVEREPVALIESVEVTEEPLDPNGHIPVEVTVENPGYEELTDAEIWIEEESTELIQDGQSVDSKTIDITDEKTVEFFWSLEYGAMTDWLTVRTDDDEGEGLGIIERDGPNCSAVDWDGDGLPGSPYEITNIDELQCVQTGAEQKYQDNLHWEITDDVAAHGTEFWTQDVERATDFSAWSGTVDTVDDTIDGFAPIGPFGFAYAYDLPQGDFSEPGYADPFRGEFNGNNRVIEGLYINAPDHRFVGMFGATGLAGEASAGEGSTIENVIVTEAYVEGNQHVGILVGQAGGTIKESRVEGEVVGQHSIVGGVVGDGAWASLDNEMVAEVDVKGGPMMPDAGLVRDANQGIVNSEGIGGVIGRATGNTEFSAGYAIADVEGPRHVGALAGTSSYITSDFRQSYTVGSVTANENSDTSGHPINEEGTTVGTILELADSFRDSVFYDQNEFGGGVDWWGEVGNSEGGSIPYHNTIDDVTGATDVQGLETDQMQGPSVLPDPDDGHDFTQYEFTDDSNNTEAEKDFFAQFPGVDGDDAEGHMSELDWDIWEPVYDIDGEGNIVNEGYPIFAWEVDDMLVTINDVNDPITPSEENLEVDVTVENAAPESQTQVITLTSPVDPDSVVDGKQVDLDTGEVTDITLEWETTPDDEVLEETEGEIIVSSEDTRDTQDEIILEPRDDTGLLIESVETTQPVEAIQEELHVTANVSAVNDVDDGSLTLRANGNLVDINESVELDEGDYKHIEFQWTPTTVDIGTADIEVEITGQANSEEKTVTVLAPLVPFEISDFLPVDVTVDVVGE